MCAGMCKCIRFLFTDFNQHLPLALISFSRTIYGLNAVGGNFQFLLEDDTLFDSKFLDVALHVAGNVGYFRFTDIRLAKITPGRFHFHTGLDTSIIGFAFFGHRSRLSRLVLSRCIHQLLRFWKNPCQKAASWLRISEPGQGV